MTTARKTEITRVDILPPALYASQRNERRKQMVAMKKNRRVAVGPDATFYFENYDTLFQQLHEMLYIEKGGDEQVADELRAYNPMIPKGADLSATMMFEIDDPDRRHRLLSSLGEVEKFISLQFAGHVAPARAEDDVERTTPEGKTSSVHFLHFDFTPEQVARLVPTEQFASRALQNMPNNLKNAMTDYFAGNLLRGN
ncbi:DUF3501 family protein [bacterium]|nr:DUF3501 family protein [bacterium]